MLTSTKDGKIISKGAAEGLFAVCDNKIIGYGWLKTKNAKDPFYKFSKNTAYLSNFFVDEAYRGNGIYPAMLSQFITTHPAHREFFISAYTSNIPSLNGLQKIGFQYVRSLMFVRILKITLNKHKITQ